MRVLARIGIALVLLLALRTALPLGAAWAHYSDSPTFRDWVREHPAAEAAWSDAIPVGTVVGRGNPWRSNEAKPGERRGQWRPTATVSHGDEVLLELALDVSVRSREVEGWAEREAPSEAFEALNVSVIRQQLDPDFHAVAVLSAVDLASYVSGTHTGSQPQGPTMQIDVFVLSGPGEVDLIIQDAPLDGIPAPLCGKAFEMRGPSLFSRLLGIAVPWGTPPEAGFACQMRVRFYPTWTQVEGGASSGGTSLWTLASNSRQYSVKLQGESTNRSPHETPGHFGRSGSTHVERLYTWQDEVW